MFKTRPWESLSPKDLTKWNSKWCTSVGSKVIPDGRSEIKEAYLVLVTSFSFPKLRNRFYSAMYFSSEASKTEPLIWNFFIYVQTPIAESCILSFKGKLWSNRETPWPLRISEQHSLSSRKKKDFQHMVLEQLDIHMQKSGSRHRPYTLCKN